MRMFFAEEQTWSKTLDELSNNKRCENHETILKTKTDEEKYVAFSCCSPVRSNGGQIVGIIFIAHDITERKRIEEQLHESEERYRTQFEEALDAIFVADTETGILIDCNRAASELVGREKSELVGGHQRILHPTEEIDGEFSKTYKQHLKEKEGQVLETQVITKKGEIKDVAVKANVLEFRGRKLIQGIFRDITEHRAMEEALRKSEENLRMLLKNLPQKIFFKDKNSVYISCNENYARDLGIKPDQITGKTDYDFFPKQLAEKYRADDKRIAESKMEEIEEQYVQDGREVFVHTVKTPVKDEKGDVVGILGIFWDITERKKMEEELRRYTERLEELVEERTENLRKSEVRLNSILSSMADLVFSFDKEGRFTFYHAPSELLFMPPEKFMGRQYKEILPPHVSKLTSEALNKNKKGHVAEFEYQLEIGNKIMWHHAKCSPIFSQGELAGSVAVIRDITERKQMEEMIASAKAYLQSSLASVPDGVILLDKQAKFSYVNPTFLSWIDREEKDFLGKTVLEISPPFLSPEATKIIAERIERRIKSGESIIGAEVGIIGKDGKAIPISYSAGCIKDEKEKIIGEVVLLKDLRERKRLEERLLQLERLAAIGETAAMVGHDLRNPLQVISNLVYLGKKKMSKLPLELRVIDEKRGVNDIFGSVAEQIEYMNKIVADLQDYAGPVKPKLMETSVHKLINEAFSMIKVPETVKVSIIISEDSQKLIVDPALMKRVFTNLITNALQSMPNGGQLTMRASRTEEATLISVEDTGVGIPEEDMHNLFQPLFTTKPKGQGFGLPVCKRLVDAHNGRITAKSQVDKGSIFTVEIPNHPAR